MGLWSNLSLFQPGLDISRRRMSGTAACRGIWGTPWPRDRSATAGWSSSLTVSCSAPGGCGGTDLSGCCSGSGSSAVWQWTTQGERNRQQIDMSAADSSSGHGVFMWRLWNIWSNCAHVLTALTNVAPAFPIKALVFFIGTCGRGTRDKNMSWHIFWNRKSPDIFTSCLWVHCWESWVNTRVSHLSMHKSVHKSDTFQFCKRFFVYKHRSGLNSVLIFKG